MLDSREETAIVPMDTVVVDTAVVEPGLRAVQRADKMGAPMDLMAFLLEELLEEEDLDWTWQA